MTRKTSRNKATQAGSPSEPESSPAQNEAIASAKKISLPAFGFAEDLLKQARGSAEPEPAATEPATTEPAATEPATAEPATVEPATVEVAPLPSSKIEETDPRRIFAFADSLEAHAVQAEEAAIPVRLETWVTFSLAGEVFALPVEPVQEVVRVASITRVPHAPRPIRGMTNMRGRVIPVVDLRLRIELPEAELGRASRVIVVNSRGRLLGLLVDGVHQVIHIDLNQVQPPPDDVMTVQSDYISGVYHLAEQLILLLDLHRVLIIHEAAPGAVVEAAAHGNEVPGAAS